MGRTLQQIADNHHIPNSYVANLLNGRRTFGGITLSTFDRMFPGAEVYLDGAPGGITQTGHHNAATANGDAIIQAAPTPAAQDAIAAAAVEAYRHRLQDALVEADIPGEILQSVLRLIKATR